MFDTKLKAELADAHKRVTDLEDYVRNIDRRLRAAEHKLAHIAFYTDRLAECLK